MSRMLASITATALALTPLPAQADIWSTISSIAELDRILDGGTARDKKGKNWIKVLPNGNVLVHTNRPGSHGTKVFHNGRLCDKGKGAKPAKNKGNNKKKSKTSKVYSLTNCSILQRDGRGHIRIIEDLGKGAIIDLLLS